MPAHRTRVERSWFNQGWQSCRECIGLATRIYDLYEETRGRAPLIHESHLLARRLAAVVQGDEGDPARAGFLAKLNSAFDHISMKLIDFESALDVANYINRGLHPAYATVHGPRSVEDIVAIKNEEPPMAVPPSRFERGREGAHDDPLAGMPTRLCDMPELLDRAVAEDGSAFLRGNARSKAALMWAAGMFMNVSDMSAGEMTLMEYGPRMAVGMMAQAARMGMSVAWKEVTPQGYMHTVHQLQRLSPRLRERIAYVSPGGYPPADVAVWNMPWPDITLNLMGEALKSGGMLMFQSEQPFEHVRENWRRYMHLRLPKGERVFPTSYAHVQPCTFQTWCKFA